MITASEELREKGSSDKQLFTVCFTKDSRVYESIEFVKVVLAVRVVVEF